MDSKILDLRVDRRLVSGAVVAGLEAFAAVALLATSAYLISRASEQPPILYLMVAVVGVRAFALGRAVARYLQRLIMHDAVFRQLTALRPVLFSKLSDLVPGVVSSRGKALQSFTVDIERLQDLPLRVLIPMLQAIAGVATMASIAIWIFPFAAIPLVLASIVFLTLILIFSARATSSFEEERIDKAGQLREQLVSFLVNVDVLQSYGWADNQIQKIDALGKEIQRIDLRRVLPAATSVALIGIGSVVTASVGGNLVAKSIDEVLPAVLAVAVLMPLAVFDVFSQLQSVAISWRGYKKARSRLDDLVSLSIPKELSIDFGDNQLKQLDGVEIENLSITRSGKTVLKDLSFHFSSGELTAVTGPSGIGKSSLALALCSLINPAGGKILISGQPLSSFDLESRRSKIILIEQQPHVFRGTLRQNLEIAGTITKEQMQSVLGVVGLDLEFSERGLLETELSEDAGNISGGQAQRIAIARGLLAGAQVLILDEPTSGLDRQNALALMEILRDLAAKGLTIIVITHDPEIAELCDRTLSLT